MIHAPELTPADAPIFYGAYTDSALSEVAARNSREFFYLRGLRIISTEERVEEEEEDEQDGDDWPELEDDIKASWQPEVPDSYLFQSTEDNIGVLAPSAAFYPEHDRLKVPDFHEDERGYFKLIQGLLKSELPASALVLLKNIHWEIPAGNERWTTLSLETYLQLGRPLHSENLKAALKQLAEEG